MIFPSWRGFSGGCCDLAGEILEFGAMIVDALHEYEHLFTCTFLPMESTEEDLGSLWTQL
jgi:hypothetical protein